MIKYILERVKGESMAIKGLKNLFKKSSDGTQNDEHILDLISAIKVKYENLQGNTDISVEMIEKEMAREERDYDMVDAIILLGQEVVSYEKEAKEVVDEIDMLEESIKNGETVQQDKVQQAYDKLRDLEKLSKYKMETIIKACEDSERERRKRARMAKKQKATKNQENENNETSGNEKPSETQSVEDETIEIREEDQDATFESESDEAQATENLSGDIEENINDITIDKESQAQILADAENTEKITQTSANKKTKTSKSSTTAKGEKKETAKAKQSTKKSANGSQAKKTQPKSKTARSQGADGKNKIK